MRKNFVKLSLDVSESVALMLKELVREYDTSVSEVVRRGIDKEKYFFDVKRRREKILLADTRGKLKEVVFEESDDFQ